MNENRTRIVVIGAGYAGLLFVVRLAGKTRGQNAAITLVNSSDAFVERPRLHQYAANRTIAALPLIDLLRGTGVDFVRGTVTRIDTTRREIFVEAQSGPSTHAYDKLVYAVGSTIDRQRVEGVRDFAYTLTPDGPLSAVTLRQALPRLNATGGCLLVCGAGATGIEAAAEFAEGYPNLRVTVVTRGAFGQFAGKPVAAYMRQALNRLGVEIRDRTTVAQVKANEVVTATGEALPYDICLWAGGFTAPSLAREAGLDVNERGQVLVDPYMRSISHPDIIAVGDAALPVENPGVHVRMSAFTAVILGAHGADSLSALLRNETPRPLSFAYLGQGIALGRHDAIGFNNYPDDRPRRPYFTGWLGFEGREFFVRLLADLPALEKRWPGIFYWLGKGRYQAAKRKAQQQKQFSHIG